MRSSTFATRRGSGGTAMPGTGAFRLSPAFFAALARLARRAARLTGLLLPFAERRAAPAGMRAPASLAAALAAGLALTLAAMPAQAQTSEKLVGNTGQTSASQAGLSHERAQAFTTGSYAGGYKLTSVVVPFGTSLPPSTNYRIVIQSSNSSNRPGSDVGTLTFGSSSNLVATWNASGAGLDLEPDTTYFVFFDVLQGASGGIHLTNADAEDSGAAAGWSIDNGSLHRTAGTTTWSTATNSWMIAIHGYENTPPALAAPTVSAVPLQPDRLSVNWTAPARSGITDYDLRYYKGSADPANEADWIEAGETGGHDHSGTLTQATITGLDPVTTYRVQVRAAIGTAKGPWSASGSGRTEALVGAWGSSVEQLVSNTGEAQTSPFTLSSNDMAQGFTSAGHSLGYTVTDVDLHFSTLLPGPRPACGSGWRPGCRRRTVGPRSRRFAIRRRSPPAPSPSPRPRAPP